HSEQTHGQRVETLGVRYRGDGSLWQQARQRDIDEGAYLNDTATHEDGKEISDYLPNVRADDVEHRSQPAHQHNHCRQLHAELKGASDDRTPCDQLRKMKLKTA